MPGLECPKGGIRPRRSWRRAAPQAGGLRSGCLARDLRPRHDTDRAGEMRHESAVGPGSRRRDWGDRARSPSRRASDRWRCLARSPRHADGPDRVWSRGGRSRGRVICCRAAGSPHSEPGNHLRLDRLVFGVGDEPVGEHFLGGLEPLNRIGLATGGSAKATGADLQPA